MPIEGRKRATLRDIKKEFNNHKKKWAGFKKKGLVVVEYPDVKQIEICLRNEDSKKLNYK